MFTFCSKFDNIVKIIIYNYLFKKINKFKFVNNNIILESNNYKNDIKNVLDKIFKLFQKNVKERLVS